MHKFLASIFLVSNIVVANAAEKTMTCHLQGLQSSLTFKIPENKNDLPKIDFDYPVNTTVFSMTSTNLLMVAMDVNESSRPRIFISAQKKNHSQNYTGQFMTDFGGNQVQLDNGAVSCKLS